MPAAWAHPRVCTSTWSGDAFMVLNEQALRGGSRKLSTVNSGKDYFCGPTMFKKVLGPVGETGKHDSCSCELKV